jgi:hypothetical protein
VAKSKHPRVTCPKCNRSLAADGEASLGDVVYPVYSCDECLMDADFGGETMELPLTFAVDEKGRKLDPADPDRELTF